MEYHGMAVENLTVILGPEGNIPPPSPLSIFIPTAITALIFGFGLYAVIRATRLPMFRCPHPSRAYFAASLVVLSLLFPPLVDTLFYCVNCMFPKEQLSIYRIDNDDPETPKKLVSHLTPASKDAWENFRTKTAADVQEWERELLSGIGTIRDDLLAKEPDLSFDEQAKLEEMLVFLDDISQEKHNVLPRETRFSQHRLVLPHKLSFFVHKFIFSFSACPEWSWDSVTSPKYGTTANVPAWAPLCLPC